MQGRQFLELAREIITGGKERHFRGAIGRAYYALMLECRDALIRWQIAIPPRENVHHFVRTRMSSAAHDGLKLIGLNLSDLVKWRNRADYDLYFQTAFAGPKIAQDALQDSAKGLATLDAIESDPVERAAAIAAIRQAFP